MIANEVATHAGLQAGKGSPRITGLLGGFQALEPQGRSQGDAVQQVSQALTTPRAAVQHTCVGSRRRCAPTQRDVCHRDRVLPGSTNCWSIWMWAPRPLWGLVSSFAGAQGALHAMWWSAALQPSACLPGAVTDAATAHHHAMWWFPPCTLSARACVEVQSLQ